MSGSSMFEETDFVEIHEIVVPHLGSVPIVKGDFTNLPERAKRFISKCAEVCNPRTIFICDGSEEEANMIIHKLEERGTLHRLVKYENCYICRTDPADVARVEAKTWIVTEDKYQSVPHTKEKIKGILGQWMDPLQMEKEMDKRMYKCMFGRTMYVIPFCMGPLGSSLSKYGIQVTDSNYVVLCMRIMTRMSHAVWDLIKETGDFVKCVHSMGMPRPCQRKVINHWPCNPEKIMISHFPKERVVMSYGSGYGGNSLLGKKCFALRIASVIARDEGWLAEHMLIMSITNKKGEEKFITAAFPSACGKTNLAMLTSPVPEFNTRCVGDDIAWLKFDDDGFLHAINPEAGFFGVAPGTNMKTNPNAMLTFTKNSIFTNIGETADGGFYWEGLENEVDPNIAITTWMGEQTRVNSGLKAAHPNSRFTAPARQCPIIHPRWEDPKGVPISAFIFGGRRPTGVPLVYEAFSWEHGVTVGACVKSEATAAAEYRGKKIMHDPMAMRPFLGYNFGKYLEHWLDMKKPGRMMPKIFHVNWFRVDHNGQFLWPGFGENIRVLDWILRRAAGEDNYVDSPIGRIPKKGSLNLDGLGEINWDELFSIPKDYWLEDTRESRQFLSEQVSTDVPQQIWDELDKQEERLKNL